MENLVDPFLALRKSRVLVTGHTGFKGSWLLKLLEKLEVTTFGISLPPQNDSLYSKFQLKNLESEIFSDVRDFEQVRNWIGLVKPNLILHLAAQPLVLDSYSNPLGTFETNVLGSANIFEAVRQLELDCPIVAVTTDKVYKNQETLIGYTEDSPLGGMDPYSASKAAMEMAVAAWRNLNSVSTEPTIVSVRSGNVIGGGDKSKNRLLPDIVASLQSNQVIHLRNPNAVRPWQHVLDPLMGYLLVGERLIRKTCISDSYNFGPGADSSLTVAQMAELALGIWPDRTSGWQFGMAEDLNHVETELLWLNSDRAKSDLGWKSLLSADESVRCTIDWALQEPLIGANAITENQIAEYLKEWFK